MPPNVTRYLCPRGASQTTAISHALMRSIGPTCRRNVPPHLPRTFSRSKFTIKVKRRGPTGSGSRMNQLRQTFRDNPFSFTLASVIIATAVAALVYGNYVYLVRIKAPYISFPDKVANKLRRALYYTNQDPDPKQALRYYKEALALCEEEGLDPFSDEVIGVKIQIAAFLEGIWNHATAAKILEQLLADCKRWVELEGNRHVQDGRRSAVLGKTVGISVKLGDLYSHENLRRPEAAETALVGAVETVLREKRRRETEGVRPGEGEWMTNEEIGGALEGLAHHYESRGNFYLATPLFLQALTLSPPRSCHTVVLMNNLATAIAQQQQQPSNTKSGAQPAVTPSSNKQTLTAAATDPRQTDFIAQAILWAQKAQTLAQSIEPTERTEECDIGCATATHNLGEFAEMRKDFAQATKRYREAEGLARTAGFAEGVEQARRGLARIRSLEQPS